MITRFGYIPVLSPLHDRETVKSLIDHFSWALEKLGGKQLSENDVESELPLVYFVISGGTEQKVLAIRERRKFIYPDEPILMIAHPGQNSLAASMEVLARLTQMGSKGRILYIKEPDDDYGMEMLNRTIRDYEVKKQLSLSRIGRIGAPSEWLVASSPEAETVKRSWGPTVTDITIEELYENIDGQPDRRAAELAADFSEHSVCSVEPAEKELLDSAGVYIGLSRLVETHHLSALTVRCFDLVTDRSMTGCLALSRLSDEGVIAGCEGDIVSTLGMLWAYQLLGHIPWMANPARISPEENSIWLAHCTIPRSLVKRYKLRSHFESGRGAALEGTMLKGPVTIFRIGGYHLEKLWIAEGSLLETGSDPQLCRTQIKVRLGGNDSVGELLEHPLGNHLIMIPGHYRERLHSWWTAINPGRSGR